MADTLKQIYKGTLANTSGTLYTVPASTTAIILEIILANKTATAVPATITADGITIVPAKSIPANDAYPIELHAVVPASAIIAGLAGTASAVDCYISGIEVV